MKQVNQLKSFFLHVIVFLIVSLLLQPSYANDRGPLRRHYFCMGGKYLDDGSDCVRMTDRFVVFVPAFTGPMALGLNVATILNLQLFRTLRKAPPTNVLNESFGTATIVWDMNPLSEPTHNAAELTASAIPDAVHIVLWGTVEEYAEGVFVQARLTVPKSELQNPNRHEVWQIAFPKSAGVTKLALDIPSRQYVFEPIVLERDLVQLYSSPAALKIYRNKTLIAEIGSLQGGRFTAERHEIDGEWLSKPQRGWLPLPKLGDQTTEVVEFTGGLLRLFRADWNGASELFRNVLNRDSTPTTIKIDSLLYLGLSEEKQQRSGRREFEQAYALNPLSRSTVSYMIMCGFSEYLRTASDMKKKAAIRRIGDLLEKNRFLFDEQSSWFKNAYNAYRNIDTIRE